ncbi:uncharacterized protein [Ptychodera flava]|uniref:uncharacterized protein n=1 Tax=Ptychodera flava TaxID=63121 RepID=UPI003969ECB9
MPLDTVLCLDTSGSMAGRGLAELKKACKEFLLGVHQTSQQFDLKENVAVVEFGLSVRVVQTLTNDYSRVLRAINGLTPGGKTPMAKGLLEAMREIIVRGGVLSLPGGKKMTPRIILMTDGQPDNRDEVVSVALSYGPLWKSVGLPHPIPIACVGCGAEVDKELLAVIAKFTNGMFVLGDVSQLSDFFRKQVLLIQFVAKFSHDIEQLRNLLLLRHFFQQMGQAVEEEELQGLFTLLLAMLILSDDDEDDDDLELEGYPTLGARVRRGRDWKWGNQDGNGVGTVVKHKRGGVLKVEWDTGRCNEYRHGAEGARDIRVVDEPRKYVRGQGVQVGMRVVRGEDWRWGDQDGGRGNVGAVYKVEPDEEFNVHVRWPNGTKNHYKCKDGHTDVQVLDQGSDGDELLGGLIALAMMRALVNVAEDDDGATNVNTDRRQLEYHHTSLGNISINVSDDDDSGCCCIIL